MPMPTTLKELTDEMEKLALMLEDNDGALETDEAAAMINDLLSGTKAETIIDRLGFDSDL